MKYLKPFFLLLLIVSLLQNCDDDDGGGGENNPNTFEGTCCQVPHLEACVGGADVFVPNAFTPNGDGINDLFFPFAGQGIEEITSFKIFKDNQMVFEETSYAPNDPSDGWDGSLSDGSIVDDVYSYTLVITNVAGLSETYDGFVCARTGDIACVDFEKNCAYPAQHNGLGGFDFATPSFEDCQ